MTASDQDEAAQKELLNLMAARRGHFKLESGHHGDLWLELDRLFLRPNFVRLCAIKLAHRLAKYNAAAVCGPLVGGALIAQTVAAELDVEFYSTERYVNPQREGLYAELGSDVEYRLPKDLRKLLCGKDIAIVDDVINAGSAVRATLTELRSCGAGPVVIGALLVLGSPAPSFFAQQNIPMESLAHFPSAVWAPSECPLCASQTPLEDRSAG